MNKICTSIEQSKKLIELGIDVKTADMLYRWHDEQWYCVPKDVPYPYSLRDMIPAWSLAALLDVIPEGVVEHYYAPNIQKENGKYTIAYGDEKLLCVADTPVDACYEMILELNKLNLL